MYNIMRKDLLVVKVVDNSATLGTKHKESVDTS